MNKKTLRYFSATLLALTPWFSQAANEGEPAPTCPSALSFDHKPLDLDAFRGKVILIDFWATWCPPCKKSMPFLNQLRNEKLQSNFEIIAVNVDEDSEEAKKYLESNPVDYPQFFDPKGQCPSLFAVKAMPSSYLVDKSGTIRKVHLGFRDEDQATLRERISALLSEQGHDRK